MRCIYIDKDIFIKYWNILKKEYQDKTHDTQDLKLYYSILKDYKEKDLKQALKEVLKNENYFPRINEIIKYLPTHDTNNKIKYDKDGVMLWNGKRCEVKKMTQKEQEELDKILKEIGGR